MARDVLTPIPVPLLNGYLSGGDAIVIDSLNDLDAIQMLSSSAPTLEYLSDLLRVPELRASFGQLSKEWRSQADKHQSALVDAAASADPEETSTLLQLWLALQLVDELWSREDTREQGPAKSLTLILAVAEPGSSLEFECEEPALVLVPGSILALIAKAGLKPVTGVAWILALARRQGASSLAVATHLVESVRQRALRALPDGHDPHLELPRFSADADLTPALGDKQAVIVFVHGLFSTDIGTFDGFIEALRRRHPGFIGKTLLLGWPHDTLTGIDDNAYNLANLIRRAVGPSEKPFVFVCHSRGGLVARATAVRLFPAPQYQETLRGCVTFGTPHEGAQLAQVPSRDFLAYFLAVAATARTRKVSLLSDMLLYQKQQADGVIQGIEDLRPPAADSFISRLRVSEEADASSSGRARRLRLLAIGSQYDGISNVRMQLARSFFGKGQDNDLVVELTSSLPVSADLVERARCAHGDYGDSIAAYDHYMHVAVDTCVEWLT